MVDGVKLEPVTANFTLKDHIYGVLRAAILDMNIYDEATDLRLDERRMAEQLGISRTPVREALARLEQDGLVDIQPRKGVFVRRQSLEVVLEMIVAWAALESMAARLAADNATATQIAALRAHATAHSGSAARADIAEYSEANIAFHQLILEMSGCGMLRTMADQLFLHMHAVRRRAMGENNRATRSVVDHMSIIEALERRDADLAAELVREHTMKLHAHVRRSWMRIETQSRARAVIA